jgi:predicted AAA+ superfamily ATPase
MIELTLSSGIIVTRDEEEQYPIDGGLIEIIPVAKFLLGKNKAESI